MISLLNNAAFSKAKEKLKNLSRKESQVIRKTFYDIGKKLVADTKAEINTKPKHGRFYTKPETERDKDRRGMLMMSGYGDHYSKRRKYQASAPYEAPAVVTGSLRDSLAFEVTGFSQLEVGVDQAKLGVNYAAFLEYKNLVTMSGSGSPKMKPRPYLSAAYKKNKDTIRQMFVNAVMQLVRK